MRDRLCRRRCSIRAKRQLLSSTSHRNATQIYQTRPIPALLMAKQARVGPRPAPLPFSWQIDLEMSRQRVRFVPSRDARTRQPDTRCPCPRCADSRAPDHSPHLPLSLAHNVDRAEEKCRERYDSRRIGTPMQDRKTTEGPINKARAPLPLMNHRTTNKKKEIRKYRPSLICKVRERLSRL